MVTGTQEPMPAALGPAARELADALQRQCLGVRVGRLHRLVARRFDQALRPLGLSLPQMEILGTLTLSGAPTRPADLAAALAVERSTMSRNLALMEQRGLVATTETSASGRSMAVAVTDDGLGQLARAREAWTEAQQAVLDIVGTQAPATLTGWITALGRSGI